MIKFLSLFFCLVSFSFSQEGTKKFAILDFVDLSKFKSNWQLSYELPYSLKEKILKTNRYDVCEREKITDTLNKLNLTVRDLENKENLSSVAILLEVDYIIGGKIKEFNITKSGVYSTIVAGAKCFSVYVKEEIWIYEKKSSQIILREIYEEKEIAASIVLMPLGIMLSQKDKRNELYILKEMKFNSEEFNQTLLGKTIESLNQKILSKILFLCPSSDKKELKQALVLLVEKDAVYINLGSDDGIKIGDKLSIYEQGEKIIDEKTGELLGYTDKKIGMIEVIMIKSPNLCHAKIVEGKVDKGNTVGKK